MPCFPPIHLKWRLRPANENWPVRRSLGEGGKLSIDVSDDSSNEGSAKLEALCEVGKTDNRSAQGAGLSHNQHRTRRLFQDLFGIASEQCVLPTSIAMRR